MQHWAISIFAVVGAFFLCGFGGAGIAYFIGLWDLPLGGFCAAFGTVSMAYVSAPSKNKEFALLIFTIGCIAAWLLIGNASYPETYPTKAYMPTLMPFFVTVTGGLIPLGTSFTPFQRKNNEA